MFTLGRDADCDLTVNAGWVSRQHATIAFVDGAFVLADCSTNGTWLRIDADGELRLFGTSAILRRSGWISLGQTLLLNENDAVRFELD